MGWFGVVGLGTSSSGDREVKESDAMHHIHFLGLFSIAIPWPGSSAGSTSLKFRPNSCLSSTTYAEFWVLILQLFFKMYPTILNRVEVWEVEKPISVFGYLRTGYVSRFRY